MLENTGIDFTVTIFRPGYDDSVADSVSTVDVRRRILTVIEHDPGITVSDLSVSMDVPQRTVEREISSLKREGLIIRTGSARKGQWVVRRDV